MGDIRPATVWEKWITHFTPNTCGVCASYDGQLFKHSEGPDPPIHTDCRCERIFDHVEHHTQLGADTMSLNHNNTTAESEPTWSEVDKTKLPNNAFADPDGRRYPHHWVRDGGDEDDAGRYTTGEMFLHRGGLNAAWAAAQGARSGQEAETSIKSHLQAHRKALGLDEEDNAPLWTYPMPLFALAALPTADGRREYHLPFLAAGRVMTADGEESNWLIPADVVRAAAKLFEGVSVYVDHAALFGFGWRGEPEVKNLAGVTGETDWNEGEGLLSGTVRLYDQEPGSPGRFIGAILDQMAQDKAQGRLVPDIGMSATFYADSEIDEKSGLRITKAFRKVISLDFVYSPGARAYVRDALAAAGWGAPIQPPGLSWGQLTPGTHPQERITPMDENQTTVQTNGGQTPAPPPAAAPSAVEQQLASLTATVERLTQTLAAREENRTIQDMGQAPRPAGGGITAGAMTTGLDHIAAAFDWVFGVEGAATPPPDLRRTDRLYYLLTGDGEWRGIFNQADALAAANPTTLPGLAVNAMNKVIVPLYDRLAAYRWYERIVSVQPTDGTLHDMAWIQFGGLGNLPVVADGAAYTELVPGDSKESDAFAKYGAYVGITEKMLRNSDIARLQAVPRALVVAAVQTRSAKIAALFTDNSGVGPTLDQDSVALFHTASHGNLATTAYSWNAWKSARIECAKQTELGSAKRTALFPRYGLFPVDLYDSALIDFGYGAGPGGRPATADNDVNPYAVDRPGDPRAIPILVPDWTNTANWAYIADPDISPIVCMAYADNPGGRSHPAPQLFAVTSPLAGLMFTNDTLPIKCKDHWAYGVATYRGIGKRNVT